METVLTLIVLGIIYLYTKPMIVINKQTNKIFIHYWFKNERRTLVI